MATGASMPALLVVLVCSLFPVAALGQAAEQQVVLVRTGDGLFVAANPNGNVSTTAYAVPAGQELCLTDIVWSMSGPPNESMSLTLLNARIDRTSTWAFWFVTATLDSRGNATGQSTFKTGPKITQESEIVAVTPVGLSGAGFTIYGRQRAVSTSPCS